MSAVELRSGWSEGSLLARLSPATREELLRLGRRVTAAPGAVVMREGRHGSTVVILRDALAKVTVTLGDGRQALLAIRASGDTVGEISALNGTPHTATVTLCRASALSLIHRNDFRAFLRGHADAAVEIAGMVADRLRWANQRRTDFAAHPVKVRLARVLDEIAAGYGRLTPDGVQLQLPLTHAELATLCGAAEVTLQKAWRELRDAGVVDIDRRQLVIRDVDALRRTAAG